MRIIIVDDFVLFREGIAALLRTEKDFEIVGLAGSVQEVAEMAQEVMPELILMDNDLPDGSGADATRKTLAELPGCKVIILTTCEEDKSLFDAVRSGAKGYLLKNISPQKLMASIRAVYKGESAISRVMTLHLMEELARTKEYQPPANPIQDILTMREQEVLRMLASGMNNYDISARLFLSPNTVKHYVYRIFDKLNITNRREAARYARDYGLVN